MAQPTFRGAEYKESSTSTATYNFTPMVAANPGDLAIVYIRSATNLNTSVTAAGFTALNSSSLVTTYADYMRVYYKILGSSPNIDISITGNIKSHIIVAYYSNVLSTAPINSSSRLTRDDSAATATEVGVVQTPGDQLVYVHFWDTNFTGFISAAPEAVQRYTKTTIAQTQSVLSDRLTGTPGSLVLQDNTSAPHKWASYTIALNPSTQPPNFPDLVAPANGATVDINNGFVFEISPNDPNEETQTRLRFRRTRDGQANEWWTGTTWSSTEVDIAYTNNISIPSGVWPNGTTDQWTVATRNTSGLWGVYAPSSLLTGGTGPTVTLTAPPTTVTNTTRPNLEWTFTHSTDIQDTYYWAIFTQAQYDAPGFSPGQSTKVEGNNVTGVQNSSDRSITPVVDLVHGSTYRFYLKVDSSGAQTSGWKSKTFTINLTVPATPIVNSVIYDTVNNRNILDISYNVTAMYTNPYIVVYAKLSTESVFTELTRFSVASNETTKLYSDYTTPTNTLRYYFVRLLADEV